jgi:hypothetical protein
MLRGAYYHSEKYPDNYNPETLWPAADKEIYGLPEKVRSAYEAAQKVKSIDTNAFAVLLRRLLEIVCHDRGGAQGKTLNEQLKELADRGELPDKLVHLAAGLRRMGNIGAHASVGELTEQEVPVLDALCRAILEYVYHAPELLNRVEQRLNQLR